MNLKDQFSLLLQASIDQNITLSSKAVQAHILHSQRALIGRKKTRFRSNALQQLQMAKTKEFSLLFIQESIFMNYKQKFQLSIINYYMEQASVDLFAWMKQEQKNESPVSHQETLKQFNLGKQEQFQYKISSPNREIILDWAALQDRPQNICQNKQYLLQFLLEKQPDSPKEQTRVNKLFICRETGRDIMQNLKLFCQVELAATGSDPFQNQLTFISEYDESNYVWKGGLSKLQQKKAKQQRKFHNQEHKVRRKIFEQSSQDQCTAQTCLQETNSQQPIEEEPKIILKNHIPGSSIWSRQMKNKLLVIVPRIEFSQPVLLAKKIAFIKNCYLHKLYGNQAQSKPKTLRLLKIVRFSLIGIDKVINEQSASQNHSCKICQQEFDSGRKLGGHMSRKHPGNSSQYYLKKQMQNGRVDQKKRRDFFKVKGVTNKKSIFEYEEIQSQEELQF